MWGRSLHSVSLPLSKMAKIYGKSLQSDTCLQRNRIGPGFFFAVTWTFRLIQVPEVLVVGTLDTSTTRNYSTWKHFPANLYGDLCCVSSCFKHHCAWRPSEWKRRWEGRQGFKCHITSGTCGAGPPTPLILSTRPLPLGLRHKQGKWNTSSQYWRI